jgi:hypothetical protein
MAKVMDGQPLQTCLLGRRPPDAIAEAGNSERATLWAGVDKVCWLTPRGKVLGEHVDHGAGESDRTAAGACLGRPDLQLAGYLGHDLGDLDGAAQQIDAFASEPGEVADAQSAVGATRTRAR